jgi:sugar transferase (PEP-CTERM system associated)
MRLFTPKALGRRWAALICGDILGATLPVLLGFSVLTAPTRAQLTHERALLDTLLLGLFWIFALYLQDLYVIERPLAPLRVVVSVFAATVTVCVLIGVGAVALPMLSLGRRFYVAYLSGSLIAICVWRTAIYQFFSRRIKIRVMIAGNGSRSDLVLEQLRRHEHLGYELLGFIEWSNGATPPAMTSRRNGKPVHTVLSLESLAAENGLDSLVISDDDEHPFPVRELLRLRVSGVEVLDCDSFYERIVGKLPVSLLRESWLVSAPGFLHPSWLQHIKRLIDVLGALALLALTTPVMVLAAIAIKLDSPGPLFYTQERVGKDGRRFKLYKFRSMHHRRKGENDAIWTAGVDPRVTRVGRILRRHHIDELPQLFNVLRGDMSLVGPRPQHPEWVETLCREDPFYEWRHFVSPGLTGWAQVSYPYGASVGDHREMLCYDLYYIKNWSLAFDTQIILQTFKVVLFGRGAR